MAVRFYLVPAVGSGTVFEDLRRPAYIAGAIASRDWQPMSYGNEPTLLVAADVTPAEHTAIASHAEVVAAPSDLTNTVGAALATVQAQIESRDVPAGWITAGMTYRQVIRGLIQACLFMQHFQGLSPSAVDRLFSGGITLASTIADIPVARRQRISDAAARAGLSTAGITGTTTIRVALQLLAAQLATPNTLKGVTL